MTANFFIFDYIWLDIINEIGIKSILILIWHLIILNYFPESSDLKTESISLKSRSLDEKSCTNLYE